MNRSTVSEKQGRTLDRSHLSEGKPPTPDTSFLSLMKEEHSAGGIGGISVFDQLE